MNSAVEPQSVTDRVLLSVLLSVGLLACLALGYAACWEPRTLVVVSQDVDVPAGTLAEPLRVLSISDLHVGSAWVDLERLERTVDVANGLHADVVLLLGDFISQRGLGWSDIPPSRFAPALGRLKARHGVLAVLGNHDWWGDGPGLTRALEGVGIQVLESTRATFLHGGQPVTVLGIPDALTRPRAAPSLFVNLPERGLVLAMTHNPDAFPELPPLVHLTLAGHTHGGQVRFPWLGALVVPSRYGARYARGVFQENGHLLHVTSGVGTSMLPVRFLVPPELVLLTLRAR